MELVKKNIHMNRLKNRILTQITLDDDFIVPDIKADIDGVITSEGEVVIDSVRVSQGRISVRGKLNFKLLYLCNTGDKRLHNMGGVLDFDENLLMDGVADGDAVNVKWDIEDLSIGIINTRKISARAVVSLEAVAEDIYNIEMVTDIDGSGRDSMASGRDSMESGRTDTEFATGNTTDCLKKTIDVSQIAVSKRDIIRVKEELDIPSNKGNIYDILWNTVRLKNTSTKLMDKKVVISGEVNVVVLYEVEDENAPVQWVDTVVPFNGVTEVDCTEDMIPDIEVGISLANINPKPDNDGEQRILELDMIIELGIKIYSEESVSFISDIYSTGQELTPVTERVTYNNILIKNMSKAKVSDKLKLDSSGAGIMQIFGSDGTVKIDEVRINAGASSVGSENATNGIVVEGIVSVNVMYISSDDMKPICVTKEVIPFTHEIEAYGITPESMVFIRPSLEQLNTVMVGNNEIEAKAVAVFDTLVLNCITEEIIQDVQEAPLDIEKIKAIPCMTGYLVKSGDTLWKIAKKYYTTVDNIRKINDLKGTNIKEGDMLLVVKQSM